MNFRERVYWNNNSYGNAVKIKGTYIFLIICFICIITPATNWIIPIAKKKVPKQVLYRY